MATVDTLLVKIEADMSGLRRDLKKIQTTTDKTTKGMTKAFKAAGGAATLYLGASFISTVARAAKSLVDLAGDIDEMQSKSSVVFGDFTGDIRGFAEEFGRAVGRSKFQLEEMASTVQDTFVPMGFARGEAAKLSEKLTVLAVDVASFNNAQDMDTMKAFQSALVGNHETVRRFGIVITEATLDQELMTMGIAKGAKEASNAQKVTARLNLILKGTTDAHGDAARTAGSYANRVKDLESSWEMFRAELGRLLIGPGLDLVVWLKTTIQSTRELLQLLGLMKVTTEDALSGAKKEIVVLETTISNISKSLKELESGGALNSIASFMGAKTNWERSLKAAKSDLLIQQKIAGEIEFQIEYEKEFQRIRMKGINDAEAAIVKTKQLTKSQKAESDKRAKETKDMLADLTREVSQQEVLNNALGKTAEQRRKISDQLEITNILKDANINQYSEEGDQINELLQKLFALKRTNDDIEKQQERAKEIKEQLAQAQEDEQKEIEKYVRITEGARTSTQKYQDQIDDLVYAKTIYGDKIPEITAALEQLKQKQFESTEAGKMAMEVTGAVSKSVSQGIADVMTNTGNGFKDFKQQMISTLNSVIQKMIQAKLEAILMGRAMSMSGGGGGFSFGKMFSSIGSFFGGGGGSSSGGAIGWEGTTLAGGGRIDGPSIVGERGPELFIPNSVGSIMNNANMKSMLSGGESVNITQNINVTTGVQQTVRSEIMDMMPLIQAKTSQAVVDSKQRGGGFSTALSG